MSQPQNPSRLRRRTGVALAAMAGLLAGTTLSPTLPALAGGTNTRPLSVMKLGLMPFDDGGGTDDDAGAPDAPQNVDVTSDDDTVDVSWDAPDSDGGSPITGYTVRAFTEQTDGDEAGECSTDVTEPDDPNDEGFGSRWSDDPADDPSDDNGDDPSDDNGDDPSDSDLACTITDLTESGTYYIEATATNGYGEGAPSERIEITVGTAEITPPSAPLAVKVRPGAGRLDVRWAEPESDGGSPITGYLVQAYAGRSQDPVASCTAPDGSTSCALRRLDSGGRLVNGLTYRITVSAVNDAGTGDESDPVIGIPFGTPGAPRGVSATATGGRLKVTWTAPASTGGSPLTGYRVQAYASRKGGVALAGCFTGPRKLTCTTTPLRSRRDAYVSVQALNAAGMSVEVGRVRVDR